MDYMISYRTTLVKLVQAIRHGAQDVYSCWVVGTFQASGEQSNLPLNDQVLHLFLIGKYHQENKLTPWSRRVYVFHLSLSSKTCF